jgi:hypothetical protein
MEENVILEPPIQTQIETQIQTTTQDEWDNHIGDNICF